MKNSIILCFLIVNALCLNLRQNANETIKEEVDEQKINDNGKEVDNNSSEEGVDKEITSQDVNEVKIEDMDESEESEIKEDEVEVKEDDEKVKEQDDETVDEIINEVKDETKKENEKENISNEIKEDSFESNESNFPIEHDQLKEQEDVNNISSIEPLMLNRMSNDLSIDNTTIGPENTIDTIISNDTIESIHPEEEITEELFNNIKPLSLNESEPTNTISITSTPSNKQSNDIITIEPQSPIIDNTITSQDIPTMETSFPNEPITTVNTPIIETVPKVETVQIPSSDSSKIEAPTIIIEEPIQTNNNQISGANSVSVSNSEANNFKVLSSTLSDYEGLNQFSNHYLPTTNTLVEQVLTQDQINALAQLNNELNINSYSLPQQYFNDILDLQSSIRPIYPIIQGQCISMNWFDTTFKANDIGVSSHGDVYAAGIDGHLYSYDMTRNKWRKVKANFDLGSITRVAVAPDGTPYVVTGAGSTYYLSPTNIWVRLPGCASDIAIGRGGEVYKIGCDIRPNGYGIYRLFNNEENELEHKKHNRCIRNNELCGECAKINNESTNDMNKVYWFRLSGSGVRISVSPSGQPYIVNNSGMILSYEDSNWVPILTGGLARDITLTNDGEVFYIDLYHNIFRIVNRNGNVYQLCGMGKTISAGPFSQPFIVGVDHSVYTSSKYIMS